MEPHFNSLIVCKDEKIVPKREIPQDLFSNIKVADISEIQAANIIIEEFHTSARGAVVLKYTQDGQKEALKFVTLNIDPKDADRIRKEAIELKRISTDIRLREASEDLLVLGDQIALKNITGHEIGDRNHIGMIMPIKTIYTYKNHIVAFSYKWIKGTPVDYYSLNNNQKTIVEDINQNRSPLKFDCSDNATNFILSPDGDLVGFIDVEINEDYLPEAYDLWLEKQSKS